MPAARSPKATCRSTPRRLLAPASSVRRCSITARRIATRLSGATAIATLYSDVDHRHAQSCSHGTNLGSAGGQAAAFTYDLARSVVYTRQGNPAWSGQERDGLPPIRSDDLFFGGADAELGRSDQGRDSPGRRAAAAAGEPHRVRQRRPQAPAAVLVSAARAEGRGGDDGRRSREQRDPGSVRHLQQRQHARLQRRRLGVRPRDIVHLSGDADDRTRRRPRIRPGLRDRRAHMDERIEHGRDGLQQLHADVDRDRLHESSGDVRSTCFRARRRCAPTARIASCGATTTPQPQVELSNGIRLDTNYYCWPGPWVNDVPGLFTGSGMPMRFAKPTARCSTSTRRPRR